MATKRKENRTELRRKLEELAATTCAIRALKEKHSRIFDDLLTMEKAEKKLTDDFKALARDKSVPGETVTLFDDEVARVTVSGPVAAPSYDVAVARRAWPPGVLDAVLALDDKKCRALIEGGILSEELAEEAELPEKQLTPAVKVEIRGAP